MSIIIKGMEMPKNCSCCRMEIDETDYCLGYNCAITRNRTDSARKTRVRNDCPLVPVPPHGRLIDADALIDKVIAKYLKFEREGKLVFAAAEIKQDIVDLISDAPTIIPASEEGE